MSPDERHRIQELRRKISEATKSSQHGMMSPPMPANKANSPRILDYSGLSSSRKLHGIDAPPKHF